MKSSCRPVVARASFGFLSIVLALAVAGCATSAPPPARTVAPVSMDGVRRVVVVGSGESHFAAAQGSTGTQDATRVFDEVVKWLPYQQWLVPIAKVLQWGINWLTEDDRASATRPRDVSPAAVVAEVFARTVRDHGVSADIVVTDREPVGEFRRDADAIVRVTVPAWGVVQVQEGSARPVAAFADVRAEMVLRDTGVVIWAHDEDVTHPERLPLQVFTADRAAARERLAEVLERGGRRLASEFVYAQVAR